MKLLIVVTRNRGEFDTYWSNPASPVKKGERGVLILNGGVGFNEIKYESVQFGELIERGILGHLRESALGDEIGIISHGKGGNPNVTVMKNRTIVFNREYSSLDEGLCVREFGAQLCDGSLPLDKLRDSICATCNQEQNFDRAFDAVWDFFSGDSSLETKLELLHQLLVPPSDASEFTSEERVITKLWQSLAGSIPNDDERKKCQAAWEDFKNARPWRHHDNPFAEEYVGPGKGLSKLRDVLLPPI